MSGFESSENATRSRQIGSTVEISDIHSQTHTPAYTKAGTKLEKQRRISARKKKNCERAILERLHIQTSCFSKKSESLERKTKLERLVPRDKNNSAFSKPNFGLGVKNWGHLSLIMSSSSFSMNRSRERRRNWVSPTAITTARCWSTPTRIT